MKKPILPLLCLTLALAGVGVLAYPAASAFAAQREAAAVMAQYRQAAEGLDDTTRQTMLRAAEGYNAALTGAAMRDPYANHPAASAEYLELLNLGGVMALLDIPAIDVHLPVRHGTGDDILQHSAGHVEGSSLPLGGENRHTVLTAHRSLPTATLFRRLDEMRPGDVFYLTVLDRVLAYQVDNIAVVGPEDTTLLQPQAGRDLVTLVTCEPYASEEFRLLVRGQRLAPEALAAGGHAAAPAVPATGDGGAEYWLLAVVAAISGLVLLLWRRADRRRWG